EMGRPKEAKEALEAALRLDASSAQTHNNLGYVRFLRGDVAGARREYLAAVRLDPDYARAYSNLGTTYFWMGQPDLAADAYRQALRIDPGLAEAARYLNSSRAAPSRRPSRHPLDLLAARAARCNGPRRTGNPFT